jgi:hypothetical protein
MKNSLTKEKALIISHPHPASTPKGRDDIFAKMLESEMLEPSVLIKFQKMIEDVIKRNAK